MKLVNFESDGLVRAGIVKNGRVYDIGSQAEQAGIRSLKAVTSVDQLLEDSLIGDVIKNEAKLTAGGKGKPFASVKLKSPVLYPEKIIMVAVNYGSHGKEENIKPPTYPYLFTKYRNALIGPGDSIIAPKSSKKTDWEAELAVVIGKVGKNIRKKDAYRYVAGYTISNDVSFRDFQNNDMPPLGKNWVKGKSLDASFPLGPWLVTADEIPDPHDLEIALDVNGSTKQSANTSDMIYKVDDLVAYASIGMTLRPGDIISTGTPQGVAEATGQPFLKDGDVVETKIQKIGVLRNPVTGES